MNQTLTQIQEDDFNAFWQHNFYDKGIQFTYLGKPIIGNHRIEHPKKTIKHFLTQSNLRVLEKVQVEWNKYVNENVEDKHFNRDWLKAHMKNFLTTLIEQK